MGDGCPYHWRLNARVHRQLSNAPAVHRILIPCDCLQRFRHLVSRLFERSHFDTVKTVHGIRLSAAQAILSATMVHGFPGGHINYHHHHDHLRFVREEQELQIQT